jgi:hypothetical protein
MFDDNSRFIVARGIVKAMPPHARLALLGLLEGSEAALDKDVAAILEEIQLWMSDKRQILRDEAMVICALDYALPRQSYAVGIVQDIIREHWAFFSPETKTDITLRIRRATVEGRAGDGVDLRGWESILKRADIERLKNA